MTTIRDEIANALGDPTVSAASDALYPCILDNAKAVDQKLNKHIVLLFIVTLIYIVLVSLGAGQIEIVGVTISDFSIIDRIGPAAIAFLYFQVIALACARKVLESAHDAIFETKYSKLYDMDIEMLIKPPHVLRFYTYISRRGKGIFFRVMEQSGGYMSLFLALAVPLFLLYCIFSNAMQYGLQDVIGLLSNLATIFFVSQTAVLMVGLSKITE